MRHSDGAARRRLTRRRPVADPSIRERARAIVDSIRAGGDGTLPVPGWTDESHPEFTKTILDEARWFLRQLRTLNEELPDVLTQDNIPVLQDVVATEEELEAEHGDIPHAGPVEPPVVLRRVGALFDLLHDDVVGGQMAGLLPRGGTGRTRRRREHGPRKLRRRFPDLVRGDVDLFQA